MLARYPARLIKISEINNSEYIKPENEAGYLNFNGTKIYRVLVYGVVINKMESDVSQTITIDDGTGNIDIRSFDKIDMFDEIDIGDLIMVVGRIREFGRKYVLYEMIKKLDQVKWFEFFEMLREVVNKNGLFEDSNNTSIQSNENLNQTIENQGSNQILNSNLDSEISHDQKDIIKYEFSSNQTQSSPISEINVESMVSSMVSTQNDINHFNDSSKESNTLSDQSINQTDQFMSQLQKIEEEADNVSRLLKIIEMLDSGDGAEYDEIQQHYNRDDLDDLLMRLLESGDIYEFRPRRYKIL